MVEQAWQIVGAVCLLAAFVGAQTRLLAREGWVYLGLNAVGGAVLAVVAAAGRDWGFFLVNGAWAVVSLVGLARTAAGRAGSGG